MTSADVLGLGPDLVRGLRVREYDALVDSGLLDTEPVELLEGALVRVSPQRAPHAEAVRRVARAISPQLPPGWVLSVQAPLPLGESSEPEPDVAVVPDEDYSVRHPTRAALVVEVAQSSRALGLGVKARLYAAGGVPEYWVLDLADRVVHVHRRPGPAGYSDVVIHAQGPVCAAGAVSVTVDPAQVLPSP